MNIRRLTKKDIFLFKSLLEKISNSVVIKEHWLPTKESSIQNYFTRGYSYIIGIFDGEELVAASALFLNPNEFSDMSNKFNDIKGKNAQICKSMVLPNYRGHNYLYLMNTKLIKYAKSKQIENIFITIHKDNISSQKSYQKLGAHKIGEMIKYGEYHREVFLIKL